MNLTLGEGVQLNIRVKARGTINQVKGGPYRKQCQRDSSSSFLGLDSLLVLGRTQFVGSKFGIFRGLRLVDYSILVDKPWVRI